MYFKGLSSSFKKNEYKRKVINELEILKNDVDCLIHWDKVYVDECNRYVLNDKDDYNKDYLELQRLINKLTQESK
ncbi:MAG: hypothetical protein E6344_19610 [Clostridium sp.]|uniref:hypothetical protein n=1 Tax=Clostridium tertium TaxID=1559 RepID=UPI0029135691|nr:hypothetical protein [Clostridium sp.]